MSRNEIHEDNSKTTPIWILKVIEAIMKELNAEPIMQLVKKL
jgi:hypothetical protein